MLVTAAAPLDIVDCRRHRRAMYVLEDIFRMEIRVVECIA